MNISDKAKAALKGTSAAELMEHSEEYDGFCIRCGEWTFGGCEPDAREYRCESCGSRSVYGAEELIFLIV
jgi:DNA-directed RNA polymerase subunit RPC12/RpoP